MAFANRKMEFRAVDMRLTVLNTTIDKLTPQQCK